MRKEQMGNSRLDSFKIWPRNGVFLRSCSESKSYKNVPPAARPGAGSGASSAEGGLSSFATFARIVSHSRPAVRKKSESRLVRTSQLHSIMEALPTHNASDYWEKTYKHTYKRGAEGAPLDVHKNGTNRTKSNSNKYKRV